MLLIAISKITKFESTERKLETGKQTPVEGVWAWSHVLKQLLTGDCKAVKEIGNPLFFKMRTTGIETPKRLEIRK